MKFFHDPREPECRSSFDIRYTISVRDERDCLHFGHLETASASWPAFLVSQPALWADGIVRWMRWIKKEVKIRKQVVK